MQDLKLLQIQTAASLPHATPHTVEHMYDSALTFDEYDLLLKVCHEQTSLVKTLFESIQLIPDALAGFQISNLAKIGENMSGSWIREINVRRQEFEVALKKSIP